MEEQTRLIEQEIEKALQKTTKKDLKEMLQEIIIQSKNTQFVMKTQTHTLKELTKRIEAIEENINKFISTPKERVVIK